MTLLTDFPSSSQQWRAIKSSAITVKNQLELSCDLILSVMIAE
jgi:hypothetical protein